MRHRALLSLLAVAVAVLTGSAQQPAQPPAVGAAANVRSPEVSADRRVTFRIAAPRAGAVSVVCECLTLEEVARLKQEQAKLGQRSATDPEVARITAAIQNVQSNQGARALSQDTQGLWSLTIGPIAPDIYEYHFEVDGFGMPDPRNPVVKYNSRPNLIESVLEVPGSAPRFYDVRPVPHGTVAIRSYESKATASTRRAFVYTPPDYERATARLPVLYLLHGSDGDETVWTTFGRANSILDNLMADGKTAPMVVVMPSAYAYPPITGVASDKQRADFEKDLLGDLIPFVEANYRVAADRDHRALAGLSMGGGITLAIGPRHLDVFSRLAVFSSSAGENPRESMKDVAANAKNVNAQLRLFWTGIGTDDPGFVRARATSDFLTSAGIKHAFETMPGAHTWIVWRQFLHDVAPQLWGPR